MRVMIINSFFNVGGPPRIVKGIYDTLIEQGHDCILAASREQPIYGMNTIKIGSKFSPYICAIKSRLTDSEGFNAKCATKKLLSEIDDYKPDVINLHNLHGYYINIELLFAYLKEKQIPVVWTLHDCWPMTGHCTHFEFVNCDKWQTGCEICPQKNEYPTSLYLDASSKNYFRKKKAFISLDKEQMTIVTPSNWLSNYVEKSFLNRYKVKVIHNGIDLNLFRPTKSKFKEENGITDKIMVLGVAQNWAEKKGLEDFIKIAELLGDRFVIVLIGLTKEQIKGLPKSVLGIKRTKSIDELINIYSSADVFVNCTYQDNFPTVNLEALACGTPVITYETGGCPESIDPLCGFVVNQGNVDEIVRIISTGLYKNISRQSCVDRASSFNRDNKYKAYVDLFESICE